MNDSANHGVTVLLGFKKKTSGKLELIQWQNEQLLEKKQEKKVSLLNWYQ